MRDISRKFETLRTAVAVSSVRLSPATVALVRDGGLPKGDPLPVAKVAAVQAAKETSRLIPYCHPVAVDFVGVEFTVGEDGIDCRVEVKAIHRTGVEMEALTGASVAALTIYDMAKMVDDNLELGEVRLLSKRGGKSDYNPPIEGEPKAAVLVISDRAAAGTRADKSGGLIAGRLEEEGFLVDDIRVVPDDPEEVERALLEYADGRKLELVLTTGGTGPGPRDNTPEVTRRLVERPAPGIAEAARAHGQLRLPFSMLSRGAAGIRGRTLIINLPGSPSAVEEYLDCLLPAVKHGLRMISGGDH
ncbi:MAG: bifunctional molybdenum cofactor biosynthesis protein MoaC/MoaB [Candidatus Glassbacteria bacterium]|nr:bifunctional molybdenum cofactor biosynthesis protein MoaC/MoaB [Candidatus Glassbacteria bacterium]